MGSIHLKMKERITFDSESKHEFELLMRSSFAINVGDSHQECSCKDIDWENTGHNDQR